MHQMIIMLRSSKSKILIHQNQKPDEVIFTNKASALNYNDIWGMRGVPIAVPLPHVSGSDVAGDVIAVGEDVQEFQSWR